MTAAADVAGGSGGDADDQREVGDVVRYDGAGRDEGVTSDVDAAEHGGVGADGGATSYGAAVDERSPRVPTWGRLSI